MRRLSSLWSLFLCLLVVSCSSSTPVPVTAANLNGLSCVATTFTGPGSTVCTVTLSAAAPAGGFNVPISTTDPINVTEPGNVVVPAGATSAQFTVNVAALTTDETTTLMATGNNEVTFSILLSFSVQIAMPGLSIDRVSLAYGQINVGSVSTQTVTLTSTGAAAVNITGATTGTANFSVSGNTFPITLQPGQSANLLVTYQPTVTGATTDTLTIADSAATIAVALSGTGQGISGIGCTSTVPGITDTSDACNVAVAVAPTSALVVNLASSTAAVQVPAQVTVAAGATSSVFSAALSPVAAATPVQLSAALGTTSAQFAMTLPAGIASLSTLVGTVTFNNVTVGTPVTQQVPISAAGTLPVTITSVSVSGTGFSVSGPALPFTLNPGQIVAESVQFAPTDVSSVTGKLTIVGNTTTEVPFTIVLAGTAEEPPVATLTADSTSIQFGSVIDGDTATQLLTLTSTGTEPVAISSISTSGANFTESGITTPLTLSPNATATIAVQFAPTTTGVAFQGLMTVVSNASSGSPLSITLTGTGVAQSYEVLLTWDAPASSTDPVAGYNVYRSPSGQSAYQLIGSSAGLATAYTDANNIVNGQSYDYIVESVDATGNESLPSNMASVLIP